MDIMATYISTVIPVSYCMLKINELRKSGKITRTDEVLLIIILMFAAVSWVTLVTYIYNLIV